jgi:hypothetical protein
LLPRKNAEQNQSAFHTKELKPQNESLICIEFMHPGEKTYNSACAGHKPVY